MPDSLTNIGNYAFKYCGCICPSASMTIPAFVGTVGDEAFQSSCFHHLVMMPETPPSMGWNSFYGVDTFLLNGCNAFTNYCTDPYWMDLEGLFHYPADSLSIEVVSDNQHVTAQIVQQNGHNVGCDSTVIVQATTMFGCYCFSHWSNGSTSNPDTITLPVNFDTLVAYSDSCQCEITCVVNDSTKGYVSFPSGNTGECYDSIMVVAHPIEHHHVLTWREKNPYGVWVTTALGQDTLWHRISSFDTIYCYFIIDEYTITVEPNDNSRGTVSGGGVFEYGTPCIVQAYPYSGYTFDHWSNGITDNPYAFPATEDVELQAIFLAPDEVSYTVTAVCDNPTMGSAIVNGLSSVTVMNGEEVTLTATPNQGCRFLHWQDNDTNSERTVTVISDSIFTAYFETVGGTEGIGGIGDDIIRRNGQN